MKSVLILILVVGFGAFFWYVYQIYETEATKADFLVKCALSIGTLSAVLFALFGDYLREKLDPIRIQIRIPKESNNVFDEYTINGTTVNVYSHHLLVINKTPHKAIKECRVWLKKIFVQNPKGEWNEEIRTPVPRLMEWAPSEYSRDKRTFCTYQVFDLGRTLENNGGFIFAVWREQGGAVKLKFPVGTNLRCVFFVSADNYQKEKTFTIQVEVPQSVQGQTVTPAKVTPI